MKSKNENVKMIVTIVERRQGNYMEKLYTENKVFWHYQCSGFGTASSDLLDVLGFGTTERDIVISFGAGSVVDKLMYDLNNDLRGNVYSKGIIFDIPLSAMNNLAAAVVLKEGLSEEEKGEVHMEAGGNHSLILVVVNQGHTDEVMDTAKKAGARGGTIIRSRWAGAEEIKSFYGITFQAEKEILAIIASSQTRNLIMENINTKHGLHSDAGAMICSVGIEQLVRMS